MTSEPRRVYVWVWLPGATEPVVAGVLQEGGDQFDGQAVLAFRYASSYLARSEAISLFTPDLPLTERVLDPRLQPGRAPLPLASALRDAAPDAWGRRIINVRFGVGDEELDEALYLLESGSDRIGALDFQLSPTTYVPRNDEVTLGELLDLTALIESGQPIPASLAAAAQHGTSIGGARPKALLDGVGIGWLAKFSSSADTRPVVQAEGVAMHLAGDAGIEVPEVSVIESAGRKVLLVRRFDRVETPSGALARRQMVSLLTVLGLHENSARYATYADIADAVRRGPWSGVEATLEELFRRLVFNVLVGNNDDHLRNTAAFWNGERLRLTPAYDLAPQPRSTTTSTQAIGITRDGQRASQLRLCRLVAADFMVSASRAASIIDEVHAAIVDGWDEACDRALLSAGERQTLWGREFCNEYAFWDAA
ncbi:MAG: type II toxin-antitoxin system HipA family toxin [Promicromonosporaceae bacterium]|nr:type II toxin-antitoxin system HipA family toxin [Promicromonosporaceae bacterium]